MRRDDPSILLAAGDAGMTLLELLLVVAIILIIAAVATPRLLRARTTANETAAIGIMRAISTAEDLYSKACASGGGFAIDLTTLGVPPPGTNAPFLSPAMTISATPQQDGYTFALAAGQNAVIGAPDCNGTPAASTFYATATPLTLGTSGTRAFAINPSHTIWQLVGQNPPTEPFANPSTPVQ